jgi:hypothetical protein
MNECMLETTLFQVIIIQTNGHANTHAFKGLFSNKVRAGSEAAARLTVPQTEWDILALQRCQVARMFHNLVTSTSTPPSSPPTYSRPLPSRSISTTIFSALCTRPIPPTSCAFERHALLSSTPSSLLSPGHLVTIERLLFLPVASFLYIIQDPCITRHHVC